MNIFIFGSGGCEYVLVWVVKQNLKCDCLIVVSGNVGIVQIVECVSFDIENGVEVVDFVSENVIDFVIVGFEVFLVVGVVDCLCDVGFLIFGLFEVVVWLESFKSFIKEICVVVDVLIVGYGYFIDVEVVKVYICENGVLIVVKVDGLVVGKGVIVVMDEQIVLDVIDDMFGGVFGGVGVEIVIEEFMVGEEVFLFVLVDGEEVLFVGMV